MMSRATFSSNVYVQSSGPCVVCDGDAQNPSQEYPTVHPSCLYGITSSGHHSSPPTTNITCYDCVDDQMAQLDHDFGLLGQDHDTSSYAGSTTSFPSSKFWICASCQEIKDLKQFSQGASVQDIKGAICDTCIINQQGFSAYDHDSLPATSFNPSTQPCSNSTNDYQSLPPLDTQNPPNHHQHHRPNNTSPSPDPTPPKRKQTRRYKKTTTPKPTPEEGDIESEPVIQWVPRRDPLPPNVCSRCRCRYARPGKKQCQHCAYDYRGTRDHRASQGLCITCAEPLDRDLDYVGQQQGYENAGDGTALAPMGGELRPRRSCFACREKNRLKKAAEKAAKSGVGVSTVAGEGSSTLGFGEGDGGGERYKY